MTKSPLILLGAASLLIACSQDPEPTTDTTAEAPATTEADPAPAVVTEPVLEQMAQDPNALREAMQDPEQRQALMQAMRERREARQAEHQDVDREAMREQMRERREQLMAERGTNQSNPREQMRERLLERNRWWDDEDIQNSIGLSAAQTEFLTQAQLETESRRQTVRQTLGQTQRDLMEAVQAGERGRIMELVEQRSMTQQTLQEIELDWWRTMLDQLSDQQLADLAEQNPQILLRRGGR